MKEVFYLLFAFSIIQRLTELWLSRRNVQYLMEVGFARRESINDLTQMVALHLCWFVAMIAESFLLPREIPRLLGIASLAVFLSAQALRSWTINSLGKHWNIGVLSPNSRPTNERLFIDDGPYRYVRHPNYTAVIMEFLALPIMGGAYITAVIFSIANWFILRRRMKIEEEFLFAREGYREIMGSKPRLIPFL